MCPSNQWEYNNSDGLCHIKNDSGDGTDCSKIICPGGKVALKDSITGLCECKSSNPCLLQTCSTGQIFDIINCECNDAIPSLTCELPFVANLLTGECECGLKICLRGYTLNQEKCMCEKTGSDCTEKSCTSGYHWDAGLCQCVQDTDPDDPDPDPDPDEPDVPPGPGPSGCTYNDAEIQAQACLGKIPSYDTECGWSDDPNWPDCNDGEQWSASECKCVLTPSTLPRTGNAFCKMFASMTNTINEDCEGDAISTTDTAFSEKTPDMVLRNGMLVYNMSQDPILIADLEGSYSGQSYVDQYNVNRDIERNGYVVYIDIDGRSGNSVLWEDVYPFYITMSGKVVPAYKMEVNAEEIGGNSKDYLQVGVSEEIVDEDGRKTKWIKKSASFKEAACSGGYLNELSAYCQYAPAVTTHDDCKVSNNECRLRPITPLKFFN